VFIVSEWCRELLYHTKYVFLDLDEITEVPKMAIEPFIIPVH